MNRYLIIAFVLLQVVGGAKAVEITKAVCSGNNISLEWGEMTPPAYTTDTSSAYIVETTENLSDGVWSYVGDIVADNTTIVPFTGSQGYYRLREVTAYTLPDPEFAQGLLNSEWEFAYSVLDKFYDIDAELVFALTLTDGIISNMQGIAYLTKLEQFHCHHNLLTELDMSANTNLTRLSCSWNRLDTLLLPSTGKLKMLDCVFNCITNLDLSGNPGLKDLFCLNNNLTTIDISANTNLVVADFRGNPLQTIIVADTNNLPSILGYEGNPEIKQK